MLLLMLLYVVLFAFVPSVIISGMFRAGMHSRLSPLWRVEAKINLLLEHAGIEFDPYKSLPQEAADAIGRGEKIRAIQIWRSATGASLKEAKDFIEEVQRRSAVSGRG